MSRVIIRRTTLGAMAFLTLWSAHELAATEKPVEPPIEASPWAKVEVSTIGSGEATLTAVEMEKWLESQAASVGDPTTVPGESSVPLIGEKPQEKCTIEVGPPGLNAIERAKADPMAAKTAAQSKAAAQQQVAKTSVQSPGADQPREINR